MEIYIIIDVNFNAMEDISIPCVFGSLEAAFHYALQDVLRVSGKTICIHGYEVEGYPTTTGRVTNHNSLGSDYGVTYHSNYGNYPCARMIVKRDVI